MSWSAASDPRLSRRRGIQPPLGPGQGVPVVSQRAGAHVERYQHVQDLERGEGYFGEKKNKKKSHHGHDESDGYASDDRLVFVDLGLDQLETTRGEGAVIGRRRPLAIRLDEKNPYQLMDEIIEKFRENIKNCGKS